MAWGCQAEGNCPKGCPWYRVPPEGTKPAAASSESHESKEHSALPAQCPRQRSLRALRRAMLWDPPASPHPGQMA